MLERGGRPSPMVAWLRKQPPVIPSSVSAGKAASSVR